MSVWNAVVFEVDVFGVDVAIGMLEEDDDRYKRSNSI